jgi:hypothetical protein
MPTFLSYYNDFVFYFYKDIKINKSKTTVEIFLNILRGFQIHYLYPKLEEL